MSIAALIRSLSAAGATPEVVALAVEAVEAEQARAVEAVEAERAKEAARKAKRASQKAAERARKGMSRDCRATVARLSATVGDPSPPKDGTASSGNVESTQTPSPKEKDPKGSQKKGPPKWPDGSFDQIWEAYPHKVGKKAALAKLEILERKGEVTAEEILAGIERYRAAKPDHIEWANPLTWLNQGRWMDDPAPSACQRSTGPPNSVLPFPLNASSTPKKREMSDVLAEIKARNPYFAGCR